MQRKKIIILIVILAAAAAAYYFYAKGSAAEQKAIKEPEPQKGIDSFNPPKPPEAPTDPNAGKVIDGAKNKDVVNYYLKNPLTNPFINPFIIPRFLRIQAKKKK